MISAGCGKVAEKPLAVDLFAGLGGWTDGLLAEGYRVVGFDIERHAYGDHRYPARLVLQDVRTIHGAQFRNASLIVASPPCQEFSYMAMPWTRAKKIAAEYRDGTRDRAQLTALFDACFRIQREAIEAAGRFIPMVVENVRGANPWVGRSRWSYGSFHLWGDVPALMPITFRAVKQGIAHRSDGSTNFHGQEGVKVKTMGAGWYHPSDPRHVPGLGFNTHADRQLRAEGVKVASEEGRRTDIGKGARFTSRDCGDEGTKQGGDWFDTPGSINRTTVSKSSARKAASAAIAKIPLPLARWIAKAYFPRA